jgi:pilus assembly protein Flp/PilA
VLNGALTRNLVQPMNSCVIMVELHRQGVFMSKLFVRFLNDESGATAIEYGLIAAGIALAIIAVVNGLGTTLNDKFTSINNSLK